MIFSSKTPRDLNHDPKPYLNTETRKRYQSAQAGTDYYFRYDPRPEFDHAQHNEPNPQLVQYRMFEAMHGRVAINSQMDWLDLVSEFAPNPAVAHARKVLTRLAALS
jgi:hypothetical protein